MSLSKIQSLRSSYRKSAVQQEILPQVDPMLRPTRDISIENKSHSLNCEHLNLSNAVSTERRIQQLQRELQDCEFERQANLVYNHQFKILGKLMGNSEMQFEDLKQKIQQLILNETQGLEKIRSQQSIEMSDKGRLSQLQYRNRELQNQINELSMSIHSKQSQLFRVRTQREQYSLQVRKMEVERESERVQHRTYVQSVMKENSVKVNELTHHVQRLSKGEHMNNQEMSKLTHLNQQLYHQISQLEQEMREYKANVSALQKQLKEREISHVQIQTTTNQLKNKYHSQIAHLHQEVEDSKRLKKEDTQYLNNHIQQLNTQINNYKLQYEQIHHLNTQLNNNISIYKLQVSNLQPIANNSSLQFKEAEKNIKELQTQVNNLQLQNNHILHQHSQQLSAKEDKIKKLVHKIAQMEQQQQNIIQQLQHLKRSQQEIYHKYEEAVKYKEEYQLLYGQFEEFKQEHIVLVKEYESVKQENKELQEYNSKQQDIKNTQSLNLSLKVQQLTQQHNLLQTIHQQYEDKVQSLQIAITDKENMIQQLQQQQQDLKQQLNTSTQQYTKLQSQLENKNNILSQLNNTIVIHNQSISKLQQQISNHSQTITEYNQKLNNSDNQIQHINHSNTQLQQQYQSLQLQMSTLNDKFSNLIQEVSKVINKYYQKINFSYPHFIQDTHHIIQILQHHGYHIQVQDDKPSIHENSSDETGLKGSDSKENRQGYQYQMKPVEQQQIQQISKYDISQKKQHSSQNIIINQHTQTKQNNQSELQENNSINQHSKLSSEKKDISSFQDGLSSPYRIIDQYQSDNLIENKRKEQPKSQEHIIQTQNNISIMNKSKISESHKEQQSQKSVVKSQLSHPQIQNKEHQQVISNHHQSKQEINSHTITENRKIVHFKSPNYPPPSRVVSIKPINNNIPVKSSMINQLKQMQESADNSFKKSVLPPQNVYSPRVHNQSGQKIYFRVQSPEHSYNKVSVHKNISETIRPNYLSNTQQSHFTFKPKSPSPKKQVHYSPPIHHQSPINYQHKIVHKKTQTSHIQHQHQQYQHQQQKIQQQQKVVSVSPPIQSVSYRSVSPAERQMLQKQNSYKMSKEKEVVRRTVITEGEGQRTRKPSIKFQTTRSPNYKYTSRPNTNYRKQEINVQQEYYGTRKKQEEKKSQQNEVFNSKYRVVDGLSESNESGIQVQQKEEDCCPNC